MVRELWGYGSETEKNIGSGKHRRMSTLFRYIYIYIQHIVLSKVVAVARN